MMSKLRACKKPTILPFIISFYIITSPAHSSPWPQPQGDLLIISKTEGFQAHSGSLQQASTSTYAEFGLTPKTTLGTNITYTGQWFSGDSPSAGAGFSTREVFLQRSLEGPADLALAARLTYAAPSNFTRQSSTGGQFQDRSDDAIEAALLMGRNFGPDLSRFISFEFGYRPSLGADADFLRSDITLGYKPDERWLLLLKSLNRIGFGGTTDAVLDYDNFRIEPAIAYRRENGRTYELGISADLGGRNTEQGTGVFFSVWNRF